MTPFRRGFFSGFVPVVETDDVFAERLLGFTRVSCRRIAQSSDFFGRAVREQFEPFTHQLIRHAHYLGKLIVSRFANADIVAETFPHTPMSVEAAKNGKSNTNLWFLSRVALQIATDHKAKELFASA